MNKSESIAKLATALSQFQAEIENPKNTADNPFFKSKYAPLNDILTLVRPLMAKHGLSILQSPGGDGTLITISTIIMHISGEWIEPEPLVLKAAKSDPQGAGSAITYGRRYSLSAILGISSEDDDDGNIASTHTNTPAQQKKTSTGQATQSGNATEAQVKAIHAIAKTKKVDVSKYDFTKMTKQEASNLIKELNAA